MALKSLHDLYVHQLKDVLSAEKQLLKALPKMVKAATNPQLADALSEHLSLTESQAARVEELLTDLEESTRAPKCKGMEGVIAEGSETLQEDAPPGVMDAAIIASAQRVEHYEIAAYGSARALAECLGHTRAAKVLGEIAEEEGEADRLLTEIAQTVNDEAEQDGDEEEESASPRTRRRVSAR